jgi:hypothetical protein
MGLFACVAGGASTLRDAGSIAAIVGASVAVVLVIASIVRWWWRNHNVRKVKPRIYQRERKLILSVAGLPASTERVTVFVGDGKETRRFGPDNYRRDIEEEHRVNLRPPHLGQPQQLLDETVKSYKVEIIITPVRGEQRRVFKKKVKTPW